MIVDDARRGMGVVLGYDTVGGGHVVDRGTVGE